VSKGEAKFDDRISVPAVKKGRSKSQDRDGAFVPRLFLVIVPTRAENLEFLVCEIFENVSRAAFRSAAVKLARSLHL
jgi:hypothetical protein